MAAGALGPAIRGASVREHRAANLVAPQTYVRAPGASGTPDYRPPKCPVAFRLLSGEARGLRIQDIGSQTIVPLLDLQADRRFWI